MSVTFVLTFVAASKGLHDADTVRECNSLTNFALFLSFHKQVFASALEQLRIDFTCIFKDFPKLLSSHRATGNFEKTLKIQVKLTLNYPRAYAITFTNREVSGKSKTGNLTPNNLQLFVYLGKNICITRGGRAIGFWYNWKSR